MKEKELFMMGKTVQKGVRVRLIRHQESHLEGEFVWQVRKTGLVGEKGCDIGK